MSASTIVPAIGKWLQTPVRSAGFRVFGLIILIATAVFGFYWISNGPSYRKDLLASEAALAERAFLLTFFAPVAGLYLAYTSANWGNVVNAKIYRWQGWLSLALVAVICIYTITSVRHAVFEAEYSESKRTEFDEVATVYPCEKRFSSLIDSLCTRLGYFLPGILGVGLFSQSDGDPSKQKAPTASRQRSNRPK